MEGFDNDIRAGLRAGLDEKIKKKEGGSATERSATELDQLRAARDELAAIRRFSYSPDDERFGDGALDHAQVIQVASWLLTERQTLQRLLVDRHPIIFVDESQDTNRSVLHALLAVERSTELLLGLIGDHRQRIYTDGERALPKVIPENWARPELKTNRRCPHRVVKLINDIWMAKIERRTEDPAGGIQYALSTKAQGIIRLYVGSATEQDKPAGERRCAQAMVHETADSSWSDHGAGYKLLVLEHQLAADRRGFGDLYQYLRRCDANQAKSGEIPELSVLLNVLLPLAEAVHPDGTVDAWREREAVARHARDFSARHLATLDAVAQRASSARVGEGARYLCTLLARSDTTLAQLLQAARDRNLLALHPQLLEALDTAPPTGAPDKDMPRASLIAGALQRPWSEYRSYSDYTSRSEVKDTHHGVKGSEFPRVIVVIDDAAAGNKTVAYEKVFGTAPQPKKPRDKPEPGKETSIDATLRLLYVTCSRAKSSLALVLWTSSPAAVKARAVQLGWFTREEIRDVPLP